MKKVLVPILFSSMFSLQAAASCAPNTIDGFWSNQNVAIEITTECKSSEMGPDYTQFHVWSSQYGTANNVAKISRGLTVHFDKKLVHILRSVDSDEIAIRSYNNETQNWTFQFLNRQKIDEGGLLPQE